MAVTLAGFRARFPEFATAADATVLLCLDDAALEVAAGAWGTLYERGSYYHAAHFLALRIAATTGAIPGGGVPGDVASRAVGDVSVSFVRSAPGSASDSSFIRTAYGTEYLRMLRRAGHGAVLVVG